VVVIALANDVLRGVLDRLTKNYRHVVIDSEAGLETHLSSHPACGRPVDYGFRLLGARRSHVGRLSDLVDEVKWK